MITVMSMNMSTSMNMSMRMCMSMITSAHFGEARGQAVRVKLYGHFSF